MGEGCILTGWQINPLHPPVQYPGSYTFTYEIPPQWEEEVTLYSLGIETAFPQYPLYELTTMADPSDKGVTWGDGNYPATVVALVDQYETTAGWGFENWEVNGVNQTPGVSPLGIFMDDDKVAVAEYGLITYQLTTYAIGCGSITPDGCGFDFNIEDDPIYIQAFDECCNYDFVGWFYDYNCTVPVTDALGQPVTDPTFFWIPVPMDVDIFGLFVEQKFDVNLSVARDVCGGAAMGGTAEIIAGTSPNWIGQVVTLLATPAPGYLFEAWYDEYCQIVVEEPQFNHTINCFDNTFVAVFEAIPYQVNVSAVPPAGGTATGGGTYYVGDNVTVTATPTVGWAFDGWFDGGVLVSTNLAYTFTMPAGNRTLEARFTITQVTLTVNVVGPGSVQVKNGATVLTPPYTVDYGTVLTLVASPDGLFDEWTGDLTGGTNPDNITMNGNKTVTATFNTCDPPTNLASTTTAKKATVTWTTPAGQTAELRYKLSTSGTWGAWGAATSPKVITGLTPAKMYNVEVRTVCGPGIYSTTLAGTFTTKMLGDVNCDGMIDVLDVIRLTGYILGTIPGDDCLLDGGDLNGDGFYNVLDVVALVNIINGGGSKASVMSIPADIYLTPDVIKLNSDGTLSGLQFELKGPNVHHLALNMILDGFQMQYTVEGHTLTGVIYQLNNEPLPAGMIDLITISGESITEWGEVIGGNYGESEVKVNKHGAITGEYSMMVYPNPTRSEVNTLFTVPTDSRVQIRLLDFSGRMITQVTDAVYSTGEHLLQLNQAQSLTPGLYILQMTAVAEETPDVLFNKEVKVVIIK
jgi:hypothetical protein